MQNLYNPNLTIKSKPIEAMTEIKNHFDRAPTSILEVTPSVYKMNDTVGATYRFNLKDSEGLNTGKQWSFCTYKHISF